ncbi:hypothetical protein [Streptomyces sp. DSM 40750]|uniref:hypothetical protein n=1 Tax=Streptomyces sp. DSM 40750 TaxID=2801030 RepID=UPI00214BB355|nr:hypothetical protein [Streptomyces sp. DSM 40750]UUU21984.1 hypothetical protein JIX55_17595 [Streptomyces sp. DSM 40750]
MAAQRPPREEEQGRKGFRSARPALPYPAGRLPAVGRLCSSDPAGLLALADRGTTTESEFTSLHNEVRSKLRGVHGRLLEERERGHSSRHGSPMSIGS